MPKQIKRKTKYPGVYYAMYAGENGKSLTFRTGLPQSSIPLVCRPKLLEL